MGYKKGTMQTYMFDIRSEEKYDDNPLLLKEPRKEELARIEAMLNNSTKDELVRMCQAFHPLLDSHTSVKKQLADGSVVPAPELIALKKYNMVKAEICHALAFMLSEPENLRFYTDALSDEMRALWCLLLVRIFVSMDEVHNILHTTDTLSSLEGLRHYNFYGYNSSHWNRKELSWFDLIPLYGTKRTSWGSHEEELFITLSPAIHRIFMPVFFPDAQADHSVCTLPEGEFRTVSGETAALRSYPVVEAMLAADELSLGAKRNQVTGQKVAAKRMNLQDFDIGETSGLRSALYVQLLTLHHAGTHYGRRSAPATTYETTVQSLIQNIGSFHTYLPHFIFAHIKGLSKDLTQEHLCCDLAVHDLRLLAAHPDNWVPIRDFYMHSFFNVGTNQSIPFPPLVFAISRAKYRSELQNTFTGEPLAANHYTRHFGNTFHKGFLYALAALGLVELACHQSPQEKTVSPYAAIAYARLTTLGRYALGLSQTYEAPKQAEKAYFQVDDQRLIVRDLQPGENPYLEILRSLARPIGSNRYEVTAQSFFASCVTDDDVHQRIKNFRLFVCADPSALWEDFFSGLLARCHPFILNHESYHIFTLPASDRHLQRLVATDPKLRELAIRAEGLRILVRNIDLQPFRTRLKALGYLL